MRLTTRQDAVHACARQTYGEVIRALGQARYEIPRTPTLYTTVERDALEQLFRLCPNGRTRPGISLTLTYDGIWSPSGRMAASSSRRTRDASHPPATRAQTESWSNLIDGSIQSKALIDELKQGLFDRNVILILASTAVGWLSTAMCRQCFDTNAETVANNDTPVACNWLPSAIAGSGIVYRSTTPTSRPSTHPVRRARSDMDT